MLRLSSSELNILKLEVESTTEDPILVLKLNAMWVAAHGQLLADNILDRIARFRMVGNRRRDSGNGQTRWIFPFDHSDDISDCRADVFANHPNAFGIGLFSSKVGSRRKLFGGTPALGRHAWSHSEYSSDGQGRRPTLAGSSYHETLAGAVPSDAALRGAGLFQRLLARFGVAYRPAPSSAERHGQATRPRGAEPKGTFLVRLLARLSLIPVPAEPPHTAAGAEPASPRELEDEFFCKSYVLRLRAGGS